MAIAIRQHKPSVTLNVSSWTTPPFDSSPVDGNLLLAVIGGYRASGYTYGTTGTQTGWTYINGSSSAADLAAAWALSDGTNPGYSFSDTGTADDAKNCDIYEIYNFDTAPIDQSAAHTHSGVTSVADSMGPTNYADELWLEAINFHGAQSGVTDTAGWTLETNTSGAGSGITDGLVVYTHIASATGTLADTISWTPSLNCDVVLIAVRGGSSGSPGTAPSLVIPSTRVCQAVNRAATW